MNDLISRKAVEKIIKEFFKTKVDEIPKREKFNKLCDLCALYLELNADLHKKIEDIPVAYDVEKVVERLELENKRLKILKNNCIALCDHEVIGIENKAYNYAIEIVKRGGKDDTK